MRQITRLTWPLSILLQAIHHLKSIWMLRTSKCFENTEVVVRSTMLLGQCLLQGWCERISPTYKGDVNLSPPNGQSDVNSALRENSKEPSSSTVSAETSFDDDSNKEALNVNKVFPAIMEKMDINYIQTLPAQVPNITCRNITWNPNLRILIMLFFSCPTSPYLIQPHATSIGYTEAYAKTIQSNLLSCCMQIIKPYVGKTHNHQKAESLRAPSL